MKNIITIILLTFNFSAIINAQEFGDRVHLFFEIPGLSNFSSSGSYELKYKNNNFIFTVELKSTEDIELHSNFEKCKNQLLDYDFFVAFNKYKIGEPNRKVEFTLLFEYKFDDGRIVKNEKKFFIPFSEEYGGKTNSKFTTNPTFYITLINSGKDQNYIFDENANYTITDAK